MKKLAISIINYRTGDLTIACIQSVLDDIAGLDAQIVVTDNASGDGSADQIAQWLEEQPQPLPVTLVRSKLNTGFSGGHNQGIAACDAEYHLILNSDAVLHSGFCRNILDAAEASPTTGFFAPKISYDDGKVQTSCFRFHSPLGEFVRAARNGLVTRLLRHYEVALGPNPDPDRIQWASFACILLKGDMVRALGPMDEGYFLYYEDAEYCLRAGRAGWRIDYVPQAKAIHYRGGSGPVKSLASERKRLPPYYYASRTRFLYQAHGWIGLLAANLLWYPARAIAQVSRFLGRGYSPMNKAEGLDIWTNFTRPLGPRRAPGEPV